MTKAASTTVSGDPTWAEVYRWAYRLLQNHDDALDAAQEVMLRATCSPKGKVENSGAWLRRVTVNLCVDTIRRRRIRRATIVEPSDDRVAVSPETQAAGRELHEAVLNGLAALSSQQRAVLIAKVYDGETFAAIAEALGISISTAKTHYVRALEALREPLRQHAEE